MPLHCCAAVTASTPRTPSVLLNQAVNTLHAPPPPPTSYFVSLILPPAGAIVSEPQHLASCEGLVYLSTASSGPSSM